MATFSKSKIITILAQYGLETPLVLGRLLSALPSSGNAATDVPPYLVNRTNITTVDVIRVLDAQQDEA